MPHAGVHPRETDEVTSRPCAREVCPNDVGDPGAVSLLRLPGGATRPPRISVIGQVPFDTVFKRQVPAFLTSCWALTTLTVAIDRPMITQT